ncbi:squalene--hopene cyclase [bacterium]|nr:squalene--hopene cyclase [bacterium]MDB4770851.1 squalene--hopene cyclase [bacterium]
MLPAFRGQATTPSDSITTTDESLASFQFFDPDAESPSDTQEIQPAMAPLPISSLSDQLDPPSERVTTAEDTLAQEDDTPLDVGPNPETNLEQPTSDSEKPESSEVAASAIESLIPQALTGAAMTASPDSAPIDPGANLASSMNSQLDSLLESALAANASPTPPIPQSAVAAQTPPVTAIPQRPTIPTPSQLASSKSSALVASSQPTLNDFANRSGDAKVTALQQTGGSQETEAAVASALRYLAQTQQANGSWNPQTTGAGVERAALGVNRHGAGGRSETAITGLALLAMIGAGNTHQQGEYADNVYRGLAFLINSQSRASHNIGSLAGPSTSVYSSTYSHGIAALAMCEAAAITQDASALVSAERAIAYTKQMQIPSTGGWRYTRHDRDGDLSQLGWQAMVLDAGHRAKIPVNQQAVTGIQRFLKSVRAGRGGLASYRPREAPTRTMTAEALATRLLIGDNVPKREIAEAERYLMQQPPGVGIDNYYYWYYATLALHQLQDDAWRQWNTSLQRRLLSTQRPDGRWSSNTVWGGYGGEIYTTSMAALCLETYYRHAIRNNKARIATRTAAQTIQR